MQSKEKIEKVLREGYNLDIGDIFNKSFEIYKKTWGIIAGGILIVGIIAIILVFIFFSIFLGISFSSLDSFDPLTFQSAPFFLSSLSFSIIISALLSPVTAGFIKICKDAKDQKELSLGTIFEYYKAPYFGNIIIASILVAIISGLLSYLFQFVLFIPLMNYLVSLLLSTITILMLPLIIFKNLNALQAFDFSIKLVSKNFFIVFVLILLATILAFLGLLACLVGIFFTMPILYAVQFCIYDEVLGDDDEVSEIDMIGNTEY
ncbi:hypothetical protein GTQ40_03715 [Flavobacteriaceae bacterium R38]|nr:hypothetical protein [Flavobacteriaceae bacterium R38]